MSLQTLFILFVSFLFACKNNKEKKVGKSGKKLEVVPAKPKPINAPAEALAALKEGNERYNNGQFAHIHIKRVLENSEENALPFATLLSCTDSEIPPEIIFDQENESLFVIRTPGYIADDSTVAVIDSAARLQRMKIVLVLGHTDCGEIKALLKKQAANAELTADEQKLLKALPPGVLSTDSAAMISLTKAHVENTIERVLSASSLITDLVGKKRLIIAGAFFNDKTRTVSYLPPY